MFDNSDNDYTSVDYWDSRFKDEESYEWISNFEKFSDLIVKELKPSDRILHVGCGNSQLSFQLYSAGFKDITNLDYSNVLIKKLLEKNPEMKWICDDMRSLEKLETETFDVVIEKAAIESLLANEKSVWTFSDTAKHDLRSTLESIYRVLKPGGFFFSVSFTPPYFRVNYLIEQKWSIEVKEFGEGFHFYFYKMSKGNNPNLEELENYLKVNRN
uniref:Methyltransferase type 11 domain-containing protein n=1 Tax=Panagrolaimus sp. PS1159 TaxID=55785 RepID=A0AC35F539_9BILA